ncbi:hypothetical protein ABBQ32_003441 [Trebouxia sp. C0010 RCD-2024]
MRRPRPHVQRGIRLALAVLVACVLGYGVVLPRGISIHDHYATQWMQSFKWCAITCVVVSAPVIGKVAQVGIERVVGTVIGGWTGYAVYMLGSQVWNTTTDGIILSLGAAVVAYISCEAAERLKLADSAKLFALTFLLVTFGAHDRTSALQVCISRISGICIGVGVSLLLSIIVYPSSASVKAMACLRQSLQGLVELNTMAWQEPAIHHMPLDPALNPKAAADPLGYIPLNDKDEAEDYSINAKKRQEHFEAETERILMDTYNSLYKCQEFIPMARSEVYLGVFKKHLCFLPGLPFGVQMGRWCLPQTEMQTLATCVRKLARLLWTLHLTFQEGFDENMMAMLKQQYPARLMPQLVSSSQATLQDMLDAFPNEDRVNPANLRQFATAVAGLLHISDFQRRRITHMMRHYRDMRRKRSSQLATSVVQQFRHAVAVGPHRLSDTSGAASHPNGSLGSDHSFHVGSPAHSTASAPALAGDSSNTLAEDHIAINMEPDATSREATWPRQHVTLPTGVAETKFDEDPEAEEAAVASAQGAGSSTPAFKGAPDRNSSTAPDALEGDSPPGGKENGAPPQPASRSAATDTATAESNAASKSRGVWGMRRERSEGLAALLDSPDLPTGRAGPYALRRQLGPKPMSNREPSLAHLAASNSADLGPVGHAMAHAHDPQKAPKAAQHKDADEPQGVGEGSAHSQQQAFAGFAPASSSSQTAAPARGGGNHGGGLVSPFSQAMPAGMDPMDAFAHLPEGLRIQLQAPSSDNMSRTNSMVYNQGEEQGAMSISLPRVSSAELLLFPETAEGHVSKVRWYSFQFLMEELAEELQEMHVALTALLIKLPDGVIKLT